MFASRTLLALAAAGVVLGGCSGARRATSSGASAEARATTPPTGTAVATPGAGGEVAAPARSSGPVKMKKYADVVTAEAITDDGLFKTHRVGEKLYFEIPDTLLGDELLLVSRIARTAENIGYGGESANEQVVRWEKNNKNVLLRVVSFGNVASNDSPIAEAVRNANFEPIIGNFAIEAMSADSHAVVIDVTNLFTDDVPALGLQKSARDQYKVRRLDKARSIVMSARSFPMNVEIRNVLTYDAAEPPSNSDTGTISLEMNHSMVVLPAVPMQQRLCDERVGFFAINQTDYGTDEQRAARRCFIARWRLEPSDPAAYARGELVTPVKPITYYIDPATPYQWRAALKQGVEDWNVAFEAAGFKNAIRALDPPTAEQDPEFSPEDARYSVIRYFPSQTENAYGPSVKDPRSGEILESDIGWYHNVMNLLRNWYFIQTAAANPAARRIRFDDAVMSELVRFVSAHEVGHTIGLPHNMGSSNAIPVDSLRSPSYTSRNGTAPSIMDYARFNYVAQPGDGVTNFYPRVGPYDKWAVEWGYRVHPGVTSPTAEKAMMNALVKAKASDPTFFYGRQTGGTMDPRSQTEDLSSDAVRASELGLANLRRIVPMLPTWTAEEGEDYDQLSELYGQVVGQWGRYMNHVASNVGGVYDTPRTSDQGGPVFTPVPAASQRRSLAFLQKEAFSTPEWLLDASILRRIEATGGLERVRRTQAGVINRILEPQRLVRMIEAEALDRSAYGADEMMAEVRAGLWSELRAGRVIDVSRRTLQRAYIERLGFLMTSELPPVPPALQAFLGGTQVNVAQSDIRAYARGELTALRRDVETAVRRTTDRPTQMHLRDAVARIDAILDPMGRMTAGGAAAGAARGVETDEDGDF